MDLVNVNQEYQLNRLRKLIGQHSWENLVMLLVADNSALGWAQASVCAGKI